MDFLNWKSILAILIGGIFAGLAIGGYKLYQEQKREEIAQKLYFADKYIEENQPEKVEKLIPEIPPPSVGYVHLRLGDYYASHKDLNQALEHFKEASKVFENTDKYLYYFSIERSAYILYRQKKYNQALELLNNLPEDIPNFCEVELLKAQNYAALNKREEMKKAVDRVLQSCPQPTIKLAAEYLLIKYKESNNKEKKNTNSNQSKFNK